MRLVKLDRVPPIRLYTALRETGKYPFIMEFSGKFGRGVRRTYLSADPEFVVKIGDGVKVDGSRVSNESRPFTALKELFEVNRVKMAGASAFIGGFVGYVAYDAVHAYIGGRVGEPSVFGYYTKVFIYDHSVRTLYFASLDGSTDELKHAEEIVQAAKRSGLEERSETSSEIVGCDAGREEYIDMVSRAKEYIFSGEAFQIVLSREYRVKTDLTGTALYKRLARINPSPYMFLLEFDKTLVGASPEAMASVEGGLVRINPIAGTAPRGRNPEEDEEIAKALVSDDKERAEHVMLVDLARNDVRKVSKAGSVKVTTFMEVVRYSHVQHIESEVVGALREGMTAFDAMEAAFPAGTLTGAPKVRAIEIIDELERSRRKVYGGCVGYFSVNESADMAIAIRMAEIDSVCRVRAGAGIVSDSKLEREFLETERKMAAVLRALGLRTFEGGSGRDPDSGQ